MQFKRQDERAPILADGPKQGRRGPVPSYLQGTPGSRQGQGAAQPGVEIFACKNTTPLPLDAAG
jgi:hypothetical protein